MNMIKKQRLWLVTIALLSVTIPLALTACDDDAQNEAVDAYIEQGIIYSGEREYELAINEFDKALGLDPNNLEAFREKGRVYAVLRDQTQALVEYNKALKLNPRDVETLTWRGLSYYYLRDYERALRDINQAIELDPQYALAYAMRGYVYGYGLSEHEQAFVNYDQAIALDEQWNFYNERGFLYLELKLYDEAIADNEKAIELIALDDYVRHPAEPYTRLANVYKEMGDEAQAIEIYNQAIEKHNTDYYSYYSRGLAYRDFGDLQAAIADLEKARELDPERKLFIDLGEIYRTRGDYNQALEVLNEVIAQYPTYDIGFFERGQTHVHLNNFEEAIADFDQVLSSNSSGTRVFRAYMGKGMSYLFLGDPSSALSNFDLALQHDRDDHSAFFGRGIAYFFLQEYETAVDDFRQANTFAKRQGADPATASYLVCRASSLVNEPATALDACDEAVAQFVYEGNAPYDARAIIKTMSGDNSGAIADFETYLDWARENNIDAEQIAQREQWIAALVADENPFEFTLLEQVATQAVEELEDGIEYNNDEEK